MKKIAIHFLMVILAIGNSHGQFSGDLFFKDPTILVENNESFNLDIEIFTGSQIFGAAQFELIFDSSLIQIDGIELNENEGDFFLCYEEKPNRLLVAIVNDYSLQKPFGTVSLLKVRGKAIGGGGETAQITIVPVSVLEPSGNRFAATNGFSASVTISPSASKARTSVAFRESKGSICPSVDSVFYGVPYMRPGHMITIFGKDPKGEDVITCFRTFDPDAPTDSVRMIENFDVVVNPQISEREHIGGGSVENSEKRSLLGKVNFTVLYSTKLDREYRLQRSSNLFSWHDCGINFHGSGLDEVTINDFESSPKFYRVIEVSEKNK